MVRREIGNIPDTWDGCYFGRTLDVSMTTAGSRPISFEFPVNQPLAVRFNWELIPTRLSNFISYRLIITRTGETHDISYFLKIYLFIYFQGVRHPVECII